MMYSLLRQIKPSGFDTGEMQNNFPVLVPDVTLLADETAKFARNNWKITLKSTSQTF